MKINRVWAMPNKCTFDIKQIKEFIYTHKKGHTLDMFAKDSKIADVTNDINPNTLAEYHFDALDFLKRLPDAHFDTILFDPPYSPRQIKECYDSIGIPLTQDKTKSSYWANCKNEIIRIIKPGGTIISFGWSSQGMGKNRDCKITDILLVPHGGMHNDTICVKEVKL